MNILSIETSCDETAISVIKATGEFPAASYEVLGDALLSQVEIHSEHGGVFPMLAKREHARTIVPLLKDALTEAELLLPGHTELSYLNKEIVAATLEKEPGLQEEFLRFVENTQKPALDLIAVTAGPGLEPALWVGVNFAKVLSLAWGIPVVGVNHMEGHILASIFADDKLLPVEFPALALLISGGHTELVLLKDWLDYEKLGETRDDAVGEAFDKVARLLDLPYPGGPKISRLAAEAREQNLTSPVSLPRPMLNSDDLDFSFSGLKTAVLYALKGQGWSDKEKAALAREFEEAVTEVLLKKTTTAIAEHGVKSLIIGGGVSANSFIRETFTKTLATEYPDTTLFLPNPKLSTDNAVMIALSGHARFSHGQLSTDFKDLVAEGNRCLSDELKA